MVKGQSLCVLKFMILCSLLQKTSAFCSTTGPTSLDHCVYKDRVFALNSTLKDYDECIEYTCHQDGSLSVCGFGINAGVIQPPPGCAIIKGKDCEAKLVDAQDNDAECNPNPSSDQC